MGRPEFQRNVGVGVFTAESYELMNELVTATLAPFEVETVVLTPPVGYIATIQNVQFSMGGMPAASAARTHLLEVYTGALSDFQLFNINQVANKAILLNRWTMSEAPTWIYPVLVADLIASVRYQMFDADNPLTIVYTWNGDINLIWTRYYRVHYTLKKVAV